MQTDMQTDALQETPIPVIEQSLENVPPPVDVTELSGFPSSVPELRPNQGWRSTAASLVQVLTLSAAGLTQAEIAAKTGMLQPRVSDVLAMHKPSGQFALTLLDARGYEAAMQWGKIAAGEIKGDHRPAMDLLKAIKVIDTEPKTQVNVIVIGLDTRGQGSYTPWKQVEGAKVIDVIPNVKKD